MMYNKKISENYAIDMSAFTKYSHIDGMTFLNINIDYCWDKECDHTPCFEFMFVFLGIIIFEFNLYNVNHAEE